MVGSRNVDEVLATNWLPRTKNIGKEYKEVCNYAIDNYNISSGDNVPNQRKREILGRMTDNSDIFEAVATQSEDGWKVMHTIGSIPGYLMIPDDVEIKTSTNVLGNGIPISSDTYSNAMKYFSKDSSGTIPQTIFDSTSFAGMGAGGAITGSTSSSSFMQWFKLPWGEITLYSSLSGSSIDFPVFPMGIKDGVAATYDTMPDMLYQYEPTYVYRSSGPRTNTYSFHMHRDMWTGDHRDGKCNELIRFCEANCYPQFNGAAVLTSKVTLYIKGAALITGILTNVEWEYNEESPIGLDDMPLEVNLSITITEVANEPLNYTSIQKRGIIG